MTLRVDEHSLVAWQLFADQVGFVPDPMILRSGEVFANGLTGTKALGQSDFDIWSALAQNLAGLCDFIDLLVTRDRVPFINYGDTFDMESVSYPLESLLGTRALHVSIGYVPYQAVKKGAYNSLKRIELTKVRDFANNLGELDVLRYDWQPKLDDCGGEECWLSHATTLDERTARAARFLLGGFIFSGFAQASDTEHYIQPKRSRFFLSLTGSEDTRHSVGHDREQAIFDSAFKELAGTQARVRRLDGLPPVLPYLIAQAGASATAADIMKRALDFPGTPEGERYCAAVAAIRQDGVRARQTEDAAAHAREEAAKLLRPYSQLAEKDGGLKVEAELGLEGPKLGVSKDLHTPSWLKLWWNDHTPFGGIRKTFRRMWMAADSYKNLEGKVLEIWRRS